MRALLSVHSCSHQSYYQRENAQRRTRWPWQICAGGMRHGQSAYATSTTLNRQDTHTHTHIHTQSIHDGYDTSAQAAHGMGICGKLYQRTSSTQNGKADTKHPWWPQHIRTGSIRYGHLWQAIPAHLNHTEWQGKHNELHNGNHEPAQAVVHARTHRKHCLGEDVGPSVPGSYEAHTHIWDACNSVPIR